MSVTTVSPLVLVLLGLICLCVAAITALLFLTLVDLRRTSKRIRVFVSRGDATMREAQRTLSHARELLERSTRTASQVQGVIHRSCDVADGFLDQITHLKDRAQAFWARHAGNGAKAHRPRNGHHRIVHR